MSIQHVEDEMRKLCEEGKMTVHDADECVDRLFNAAHLTVHNWIPSTLGHGHQLCSKCLMTLLEAEALEQLDRCNG